MFSKQTSLAFSLFNFTHFIYFKTTNKWILISAHLQLLTLHFHQASKAAEEDSREIESNADMVSDSRDLFHLDTNCQDMEFYELKERLAKEVLSLQCFQVLRQEWD